MGRRGGGRSSSSSRSGGLFGSRSKPAAARAPARKTAPPPAKTQSAPPPAQPQQQPSGGGGGLLSGLAGTVMQGMAFGTGSAVAHRAVDAIAGPRQVEHVNVPAAETAAAPTATNEYATASAGGVCGDEYKDFNQCVQQNQGQIGACKFYYDVLSQCQNNSGSGSNWS